MKIAKKTIFILIHIGLVCGILYFSNCLWKYSNEYKTKESLQGKPRVKKTRARKRAYSINQEEQWYFIDDKPPPVNIPIIAELQGNKIFNLIKTKVREGEGLGHIKRWRYLTHKELLNENQISSVDKIKQRLW